MSANSKIFKGPGPIQVPRLAADPASGVNGEIYYNTATNRFRVYENGSWIDSSPASAANTALSNLQNPTSINQALIPSGDNTLDIGQPGTRWNEVFSGSAITNTLKVKDQASGFSVDFAAPSLAATTAYTLPAADGTSGQVLQTNGSGVLSWASAGSGANTALSNLAAVAINTNLTFATNVSGVIETNAQTNISSDPISIYSGGVTVNDNASESTGNIVLASGVLISNAAGGQSGSVDISSGNSDTISGVVNLYSGTGTLTNSSSGDVSVYSGDATGTGVSGNVEMMAGDSVDGNAGTILIYSGNTSGAGACGPILITAGSPTGSGTPGAITLAAGNGSATAQGGQISLNAGNDGGAGGGVVTIGAGNIYEVLSPLPVSYVQLSGAQLHGNGENNMVIVRLPEATLAASTGSATLITDHKWDDALLSGYSIAKVEYSMWEKVTGKVRHGKLYVAQNAVSGNETDIAYNDVVEVENTSFPAVVLSVARVSTHLEVQFTNPSSNDVLIQSRVTLYPNNVGAL